MSKVRVGDVAIFWLRPENEAGYLDEEIEDWNGSFCIVTKEAIPDSMLCEVTFGAESEIVFTSDLRVVGSVR